MPVTLSTSTNEARSWRSARVSNVSQLFEHSRPKDYNRSKRIIQSSFSDRIFSDLNIAASEHGFVWAVYSAYSNHHHLTLRPEDVWFSILAQLQYYINAHAEELRSYFVAHEGRKPLRVVENGDFKTTDFADLAIRITELVQENVKDPELRDWVMPTFSTTTDTDRAVAAILLMGALQKYFSYEFCLDCGIPSVTLLGERDDWAQMLDKLEPICRLGEEPRQFVSLLRPVLRRFVASFDRPTSADVIDFWSKCAHKSGGSGTHYLSGWLTAFCFWDDEGKSLFGDGPRKDVSLREFHGKHAGCELDGEFYHRMDSAHVPAGLGSAPVTIYKGGVSYDTVMLAGLPGIQVQSSNGNDSGPLDSIQPLSGWWLYEKEDAADEEAREKEIEAIKDELNTIISNGCDSSNSYRLTELYARQLQLTMS